MKKLFLIVAILIISTTSHSTQNESQYSELLLKIQNQVTELNQVISEIGRDKIGDIYFQRLNESKVALAQLKAEPIENKSNIEELNRLYFAIDNIFHPENKISNQEKLEGLNHRDSGGNGIIRGRVIDELTGENVDRADVYLYDSSGNYLFDVDTDTQGRYMITGVEPGDYIIISNGRLQSVPYIYTAYPNIPCNGGLGSGCQVDDMQLITLTEGQIFENININLVNRQSVSGVVTDKNNSNLYISSAHVLLTTPQGNSVSYGGAYTNQQGEYQIYAMDDGDYTVSVTHSSYQSQMYDNVNCMYDYDCDFDLATVLIFSENQSIDNIDFLMARNPTISGTVVDADDLSPLNHSRISIYDGNQVVASTNSGFGNNWSVEVSNGNYQITSEVDGYFDTKYNSVACYHGCANALGVTINHFVDDTNNLVLKQVKGASINGKVRDENGQAITDGHVNLYTSELGFRGSKDLDDIGMYDFPVVADGLYYIEVVSSNYINEVYPDTRCEPCDLTIGETVEVLNGIDLINMDFILEENIEENIFIAISGTIVDQDNNPAQEVNVWARKHDSGWSFVAETTYSDINGNYSFNNLQSGHYQITAGNSAYLPKAYDDVSCNGLNCLGETYTPVITEDTDISGIDFSLVKKGKVNVNLTTDSNHQITTGSINIFDSAGNYVTNFLHNDTEDYIYLLDGEYYLTYRGWYFVSKVYGGNNCPYSFEDCDPLTGTLISVSHDTEQTISMNIDEHFYVEIEKSPDIFSLKFYNSDFSYYGGYNYRGRYYILSPEPKYLKIEEDGFYSQIYNGINCVDPNCDFNQGQLIYPVINGSLDINYTLLSVSSISGTITNSLGVPISNASVYLYTSLTDSSPNREVVTNENGEYEIESIILGDYYLVAEVSNESEYASTYYGNISCEITDCNTVSIPVIALNPGDYLQGYDIQLPSRGSISGESIFNTRNQTVPSTISIYRKFNNTNSPSYIKSIDVKSDGSMLPIYLPNGEYQLIVYDEISFPLYSSFPTNICDNVFGSICARNSEVLTVESGNNTHFNGFVVHQNGMLKGRLIDSVSNQIVNIDDLYIKALGSGDVQIFDDIRDGIFSIFLKKGDYNIFAETSNFNESISQLYNNIDCYGGMYVDCNWFQGDVVNIDYDMVVDVDFYFNRKPEWKIKFFDKFSQETISSDVNIFDINKNHIYISSNRTVHNIKTLPPGSYYIIASNYEYQVTGYPDVMCFSSYSVASCVGELTLVNILPDNPINEIEIQTILTSGINGYVKESGTGIPLENIIIDFWDINGSNLGQTITSKNGGFSQAYNSGGYYISTDTGNAYEDEIYKDIHCQTPAIFGDCEVTQGEIVNIPNNNIIPIILDVSLSMDPIFSNGFE